MEVILASICGGVARSASVAFGRKDGDDSTRSSRLVPYSLLDRLDEALRIHLDLG